MNILVIGNGFDLAHGLPTKYKDFLIWVINEYNFFLCMKKQDAEITKDVDNITLDVPNELLSKAKDMSQMQYNIQHELWEMINNNIWLEYFLNNSMYKKENWVDFEREISKVIRTIDDDMKSLDDSIETLPDNIKKVYIKNIIQKGEQNTYRALRDKLLDDLNKLIRAFEIYLTNYIEKIEIKKISPDIKNLDIDHVLSFNYTNTYEKRYSNSKVKEYDYIHGKADINNSAESNNMVLGIDEYLGKKKRNKEVDFIAFKKFYQRIRKQTGCKYREWVDHIYINYMNYINNQKKLLKQSNNGISTRQTFCFRQIKSGDIITAFDTGKCEKHNLYIFGHSLDVTDKDILRDLILNDNVHTTIFYHNKDVMGQQITNLVKVIDQDELIRRTGGSTKTIEFKQQQNMIKINS